MGMETQGPVHTVGRLTPAQVKTFQKVEPKALGSIQIIIAALCLCLSVSILQIYYEVHFTPDLIVVVVIVLQLLASGSILIHAGRFPSLFWVKTTLVVHLVSAAFSTAALGLLSRHLPYRQDSYHCEHCRRLEIYAVLLIDGLLTTLVLFLVVELAVCIVTILFGLAVLAKGGLQLPGVGQHVVPPAASSQQFIPPSPVEAQVPTVPQQVEVVVREPEPEPGPAEEISTPPTEPQVEPIDSFAEI
ncbi:uncharacterized protein LOC143499238 isoform X3 [Brachyhypopomus gauderio]|uniref:uncharacterized protein LOC143499238 isoform X3 n=1 Tax=Brachyhypopomus gauderio TaxID=698409 RepID=UPI004041FEF5